MQNLSDSEFLVETEYLAAQLETWSNRTLSDVQARDPWTALVTWDQLKKLAASHITIGSHTADHVRLGVIDAETARNQLADSKRAGEAHTGASCWCVSYPNGSCTQETTAVARECGYRAGLTTDEGLNRCGDDPMRLRRIGLGVNWSTTELLARVSELSSLLCSIGRRNALRTDEITGDRGSSGAHAGQRENDRHEYGNM